MPPGDPEARPERSRYVGAGSLFSGSTLGGYSLAWMPTVRGPEWTYHGQDCPIPQTNSNSTVSAPITPESLFAAYREAVHLLLAAAPGLPPAAVRPAPLAPDDARTRAESLLGSFGSPPLPSVADLDIDVAGAIDGLGSMEAFFDYVEWKRERKQQYLAATNDSVLRQRLNAFRAWERYADTEDAALDARGEPRSHYSLPRLIQGNDAT